VALPPRGWEFKKWTTLGTKGINMFRVTLGTRVTATVSPWAHRGTAPASLG
jgi:hypothetical protein